MKYYIIRFWHGQFNVESMLKINTSQKPIQLRRISVSLQSEVGFPGGSVVKNLPTDARDTGDMGSSHGLGRSPGGGNGNRLQCSYLENPTDRGAWQAIVHRVARSWTWLSDWAHIHAQPGAALSRLEAEPTCTWACIWSVITSMISSSALYTL